MTSAKSLRLFSFVRPGQRVFAVQILVVLDASFACWEWHRIRADEASALLTALRLSGCFNGIHFQDGL